MHLKDKARNALITLVDFIWISPNVNCGKHQNPWRKGKSLAWNMGDVDSLLVRSIMSPLMSHLIFSHFCEV